MLKIHLLKTLTLISCFILVGYLPGQLYNLDASKYGKGIDLRNLLDILHKHGICGIADVVINHRTAGKQDPNGHWNIFEGGVPDKRLAWGAWAVSMLVKYST
jgi:alpha-amylase